MGLFGSSQPSEIPTKLHTMWGLWANEATVPPATQSQVDALRQENKDWEIHIHQPLAINQIAPTYMGGTYNNFPRPIQQCNACRAIFLHKFGGIYSDLDIDFHRPLNALLAAYPRARVLLVEAAVQSKKVCEAQGDEHPIRDGEPELPQRIGNYLMASTPGHSFWDDVMLMMKERSKLKLRSDYDVSYTTGTDVISEVYYATKKKYDDVVVIPQKKANKFFTHHAKGSWRSNEPN